MVNFENKTLSECYKYHLVEIGKKKPDTSILGLLNSKIAQLEKEQECLLYNAFLPTQERIYVNITNIIAACEKRYLTDIGDLLEIQENRTSNSEKLQHTDYYLRILSPELANGEEGLSAEPAFKKLLSQLDKMDDDTLPNPLYFGAPQSLDSNITISPYKEDDCIGVGGNLQFGLFRDHARTGKPYCYGLIGWSIAVSFEYMSLYAAVTLETVYIHKKLRSLGLGESIGIASAYITNELLTTELIKSECISSINQPHIYRDFVFSADYISSEASNTGDPFGRKIGDCLMQGKTLNHGVGWGFSYDVGI